ncbi:hypothetical protein PYCCODRAFT_1440380 [Trametes coccinea BRFM310]|uniref:F-box domain-containing protein n=1 Tax=Trametes coccinea (strain BRFM310) TaxID=1353009 RepID=A0A1Y2I824_TRAC3|nr:hypothetical protein PYCCODRAFT_1440380 [Trametes coccinea BRFM310]
MLVELVDIILGFLRDDWRALAACHLVDPDVWAPLALAHLSKSQDLALVVDGRAGCSDVGDFHRIFLPDRPISQAVRFLTVRGANADIADLLPFPDELDLRHLPHLTSLRVQRFVVDSLQIFTLVVARCHALRELSIDSVLFERDAATNTPKAGPVTHILPPNLQTLRILEPREMSPISFVAPLIYSMLCTSETSFPVHSLMLYRGLGPDSSDGFLSLLGHWFPRIQATLMRLSISVPVVHLASTRLSLLNMLAYLQRFPDAIIDLPRLCDLTIRYQPEDVSSYMSALGRFFMPKRPLVSARVLQRIRLALPYSRPTGDIQATMAEFARVPHILSKDVYPALSDVHINILWDPDERGDSEALLASEVDAFVHAVRSAVRPKSKQDAVVTVDAIRREEWEKYYCSLSAWNRMGMGGQARHQVCTSLQQTLWTTGSSTLRS